MSPAVNRGSILRYGLDWRRMGAARGIAGSHGPEREAIFVCDRRVVDWFVGFGTHPLLDVWEVQLAGLEVAEDSGGWWVCLEPVPPERLRLIERDRRPPARGQGAGSS